MKNNNILISVVIPVYNVEKYLSECLDSIINQTFSEIEIICINDGSTDKSLEILEEYKKKDKRLIIFTQKNIGLSGARNTGMRLAKGKYIYFIDSDDMLVPNALEKLFGVSEEDQLDIVFFSPQILYEDQNLRIYNNLDKYFEKKNEYVGVKTGKEMFCEMQGNDEFAFAAWLCFLKRDFLETNKINFYEGIIYEDNIFLIQCFMLAERTSFLSDKLYIYRIRKDSIMTSERTLNYLRSRLICIEETFRIFYTFSLDDMTKKYLSQIIVIFLQNAKNIRNQMGEVLVDDENIATTYVSDILYKGLGFNEYLNKNHLALLGLEVLIEKAQNIILYGAGEIGKKVFILIKLLGYEKKIKYFVISNKVTEDNTFENIPICEFEKLEIDEKDLLIVSASTKFHHEMIKKIERKKISNYEIITRELARMIEKKIDE